MACPSKNTHKTPPERIYCEFKGTPRTSSPNTTHEYIHTQPLHQPDSRTATRNTTHEYEYAQQGEAQLSSLNVHRNSSSSSNISIYVPENEIIHRRSSQGVLNWSDSINCPNGDGHFHPNRRASDPLHESFTSFDFEKSTHSDQFKLSMTESEFNNLPQ
ncbi:hypothetical protein DID78_04820 [Candidatus Marinamargulisbacteria bacterium SCGC AG-343-D04]|nr:hypothetical protein DID78_04820 [Candidatus Marinamargulisbacteria bacterium SCGC AG-343-D04]